MEGYLPCVLCGEIHPITIHSYPERKVRDPETEKNKKIQIVCIECLIAKEAGKQHTKRILPDFLQPYCRIRLDLAYEFYTTHNAPFNIDEACIHLGCSDERTAKRHLGDVEVALKEANLILSQYLSEKNDLFPIYSGKSDISDVDLLTKLIEQIKQYHIRLVGHTFNTERYNQLKVIHDFLCYQKISTTYVSKTQNLHDTS